VVAVMATFPGAEIIGVRNLPPPEAAAPTPPEDDDDD
jgi:hypothetical protein